MDKEDITIVRLIANTKTRKRPDNIEDIAKDIEWLINELGSIKVVSNIIGISTEMLNKFLAVNKLSKEVRNLVKERKIDSVAIVHLIKKFNNKSQLIIAKEVVNGRLNSEDVKVLVPISNKLQEKNINEIIERVVKSKNQKVYIAYFMIPYEFIDNKILEKKFEKIVGKEGLLSLKINDNIGSLELTHSGQKKLRNEAKTANKSLKKFVDGIIVS